ncbi:hypothetical protein BDZ45DRAFT_783100, partial [Acephala macrosclerotiorum]
SLQLINNTPYPHRKSSATASEPTRLNLSTPHIYIVIMEFQRINNLEKLAELPEAGQVEENKKQRTNQTSLLIEKLPYDVLYEIMKLLGPASQRLLGATCFSLHSIYKIHFHQPTIIAHRSEMPNGLLENNLIVSPSYHNILADWLISKDSIKGCKGAAVSTMKTAIFGNMWHLSQPICTLSNAYSLRYWFTVTDKEGENARPERSLTNWGGKGFMEVEGAKDTKVERDGKEMSMERQLANFSQAQTVRG